MIVGYADFSGLLSIGINPDAVPASKSRDADREILDSYMEVYEREYLRRILGEEQYAAFAAYVSSRPDDAEGFEGEERWERLLSLLKEQPSPVACFIFFRYVETVNYSVTKTGVVKPADGDSVSPAVLQVRVWNEMVRANRRVFGLLCRDEYEGVVFDRLLLEPINLMGI